MTRYNKDVKNLVIDQKRIAQAERQIERSLRGFAMDNSKKLKLPTTDEEKGLEILARGQ